MGPDRIENTSLGWPTYFPEGCPPVDAADAAGEVFRVVANNPPISSDFEPSIVEVPGRDYAPQADAPPHGVPRHFMACGLSVFKEQSEVAAKATYLRGVSPRLRHAVVAKGMLSADLGKMKQTPSRREKSHHTWWLPVGALPAAQFAVVSIESE